jgi:Zn-dependent protease with chaperone function
MSRPAISRAWFVSGLLFAAVLIGARPIGAAPRGRPDSVSVPAAQGRARSDAALAAFDGRGPLPAGFRPHVAARAVRYQRTARALGLAGSVWSLIGLWLLLRSGISARIRDLAIRTARSNRDPPPTLVATIVFFAAYTLAMQIWTAPFTLADFDLEHRFGFSTQSFGSLLSDTGIGCLVSLLIAPLLWAGFRLYARTRRWWLWLWALTVPLLLAQTVLQPVLIAPLFNRYVPLPPGRIRTDVLALAGKAGITGARVYVESTSLRSTHVNAYVTGIGPTTRIVINDTALRLLPEDQLLAMVGHEMGHYVEGHVWIFFATGAVGTFLFLLLAQALLPWLAERKAEKWRLNGLSDLAALPMIYLVIGLFLFVQSPVDSAISRALEHRADAFGLRVANRPIAMARLFVGFAERDYSDPDPPALLQFWYGTHPTLDERIRFALQFH